MVGEKINASVSMCKIYDQELKSKKKMKESKIDVGLAHPGRQTVMAVF